MPADLHLLLVSLLLASVTLASDIETRNATACAPSPVVHATLLSNADDAPFLISLGIFAVASSSSSHSCGEDPNATYAITSLPSQGTLLDQRSLAPIASTPYLLRRGDTRVGFKPKFRGRVHKTRHVDPLTDKTPLYVQLRFAATASLRNNDIEAATAWSKGLSSDEENSDGHIAEVDIQVVLPELNPLVVAAHTVRVATLEDVAKSVVLHATISSSNVASVAPAYTRNHTKFGRVDCGGIETSRVFARIETTPAHGVLYRDGASLQPGDVIPAIVTNVFCDGRIAGVEVEEGNLSSSDRWLCSLREEQKDDAFLPRTAVCTEVLYVPDIDHHNYPVAVAFGNSEHEVSVDTWKFTFVLIGKDGAEFAASNVSRAFVTTKAARDAPLLTRKIDGKHELELVRAPFIKTVKIPGVVLTGVDGDALAVRVRVSSAFGNYLSFVAAGLDVLAACRTPFTLGDGILDPSFVEFVAVPRVAAILLANLEYIHVNNTMPIAYNLSSARAPAVLVDTVLVTISDGWCFHRDDNDMNGCISHPTEARHYFSLAISVTPHGEMHKTIPARVLNCCEEFIWLSTVCFGLGSLAAFVLTAAWRYCTICSIG